jgi:nucleoside-diphosphate-sugar epimerase
MKTVLILGASGFLGRQCSLLFQKSNYSVITTDKTGRVDLKGDLSCKVFVQKLPKVDVVVNCAAVQYVSEDLPFFKRKRYFEKNNLETIINLSDHYIRENVHFIHVGTSMMYLQDGREIYDLTSPMLASGLYSESKLEAQSYVDRLLMTATVIPCIIGGIGREGLFRGFVNSIKEFNMAIFPGSGDHKIAMVHVDDVALLILQIAHTSSTGYFNAAADDALTIREWIDIISDELKKINTIKISVPLIPIKIFSKLIRYRILAREQLLMLSMPHVLDISKSISIGWRPIFTTNKIVRDITNYVVSEKVIVPKNQRPEK